MPYATMWSGIIIQNFVHEILYLHNHRVESHFHTIKHTVLEGNEKLSIGCVVRRLKNYTKSLIHSIRLRI